MSGFTLADLDRRMASILRFATITDIDAATARVKVSFGGETESAWLQFSTGRAGGARIWSPPVAGEQVVVFSPSGDTGQGVVLASLPSAAFPPPSADAGTYQVDMPGGVSISVSGGSINITVPGNIMVNGDVVADGISLKTHLHSGIMPGASNTGQPV